MFTCLLSDGGGYTPVQETVLFETQWEKNGVSEDRYWLYQCVEAEEEGMGYRAKYLTASCIMNRLHSGHYGDTITETIFSPNQFEVVTNGRINRVIPTEETIRACEEAFNNPETWVIGFSQGDCHTKWGWTVKEVINGEYYYRK